MSHLWWLTLVAAGIIFSVGTVMWLNTATAMVRVMLPTRNWLAKESNLNTWGGHLMAIGALLVILGVMFVGWH
jgi:hypothetical protein